MNHIPAEVTSDFENNLRKFSLLNFSHEFPKNLKAFQRQSFFEIGVLLEENL
jgi:hypothetical protein